MPPPEPEIEDCLSGLQFDQRGWIAAAERNRNRVCRKTGWSRHRSTGLT